MKYYMVVQNDGNVVIYTASNFPVWEFFSKDDLVLKPRYINNLQNYKLSFTIADNSIYANLLDQNNSITISKLFQATLSPSQSSQISIEITDSGGLAFYSNNDAIPVYYLNVSETSRLAKYIWTPFPSLSNISVSVTEQYNQPILTQALRELLITPEDTYIILLNGYEQQKNYDALNSYLQVPPIGKNGDVVSQYFVPAERCDSLITIKGILQPNILCKVSVYKGQDGKWVYEKGISCYDVTAEPFLNDLANNPTQDCSKALSTLLAEPTETLRDYLIYRYFQYRPYPYLNADEVACFPSDLSKTSQLASWLIINWLLYYRNTVEKWDASTRREVLINKSSVSFPILIEKTNQTIDNIDYNLNTALARAKAFTLGNDNIFDWVDKQNICVPRVSTVFNRLTSQELPSEKISIMQNINFHPESDTCRIFYRQSNKNDDRLSMVTDWLTPYCKSRAENFFSNKDCIKECVALNNGKSDKPENNMCKYNNTLFHATTYGGGNCSCYVTPKQFTDFLTNQGYNVQGIGAPQGVCYLDCANGVLLDKTNSNAYKDLQDCTSNICVASQQVDIGNIYSSGDTTVNINKVNCNTGECMDCGDKPTPPSPKPAPSKGMSGWLIALIIISSLIVIGVIIYFVWR
jgi:hypothetical protein